MLAAMPANLYALGAIALWVLLASLGVEFDVPTDLTDPKARLALMRKNLKQQLGIGTEFIEGACMCLGVCVRVECAVGMVSLTRHPHLG